MQLLLKCQSLAWLSAAAPLGLGFLALSGSTQGAAFFDGADDAEGRAVMEQARQRIEAVRKAEVSLQILGPDGKPMAGSVEIQLRRHAFLFGAAASDTFAIKPGGKATPAAREMGLEVAAELFNVATINCHWSGSQPTKDGAFNWRASDQLMEWAVSHGLSPRMHCLIYMNEGCSPKWRAEVKSTEEWWQLIDRRIAAVAERYGKNYIEYDVLNETNFCPPWNRQNNPLFPDYDAPATGVRIFQIARKHLPQGKLLILDQFIPTSQPGNRNFERYMDYCRKLIAQGAPVDAIGYQGHFYTGKPSFQQGSAEAGPDAFRMKALAQGLDRLAGLGRPVHITEFNPPSRNNKVKNPNQARLSEEEVAAWSVNFYTLAFSKPYIQEITRWFLVDDVGGRGTDAGLVTLTGKKKPEYYALKKLLKETWNTEWKGEPKDGTVSLRGFYGEYEIIAPGCKPAKFVLGKGGPKEISLSLKHSDGQ